MEPLRVIVLEAAILAAWDLANTQRLKKIQTDTVPAPVLSTASLASSSTALALLCATQWNPPREFPVKVLMGFLHGFSTKRLFPDSSLLSVWARFCATKRLYQLLGQSFVYDAPRRQVRVE